MLDKQSSHRRVIRGEFRQSSRLVAIGESSIRAVGGLHSVREDVEGVCCKGMSPSSPGGVRAGRAQRAHPRIVTIGVLC